MLDWEIGGVKAPRHIIDTQNGPECGYEALENVVQLFLPGSSNQESERLKQYAAHYGFANYDTGQSILEIRGYKRLLSEYGIGSRWFRFEPNLLIAVLRENRAVVAVVAPEFLDPNYYTPDGTLHAIVLTNFTTDAQGNCIALIGIDSNFGGEERRWKWDAMVNAIEGGGNHMLITEQPMAHEYWSTYEMRHRGPHGWMYRLSPTA